MFHIAFQRGRGLAFPDLPPTLQPCAIAAAAPSSDHMRAAALSGLIYLLLGGAVLAFTSLASPAALVIGRPTTPERIVEFDGPAVLRPIQRLLNAPSGSGERIPASASNAAVAPRPEPEEAAPALSTENHRGDLPGVGPAISGPLAPANASPNATSTVGPSVHDFSMTGLAILRQVDPVYPDFARRARIQGPVVLLMTVDERGQPIHIQVLDGHPAFHEAALQAARQWRFEPARSEGRPVSASFRLTLKFSLR
jgi:protein TonB